MLIDLYRGFGLVQHVADQDVATRRGELRGVDHVKVTRQTTLSAPRVPFFTMRATSSLRA
ncbi:hypothetical protein IPZ58_36130 [Streptomyces roseoverticillatus]|uniref:hypothetical protein n=1 Tax=Streptomyces roseoverticillatus TaxID=66429 RepID=UPI001F38A9B4|nr:hypothetical protein [Streptomyces roseoverticillatus]MCF3106952.1 hypothetical protein [Streptomyces roseoverticillatus]